MDVADAVALLPRALASHRCAAVRWGVPLREPLEVTLTVPRSCRRRLDGVRLYRRDIRRGERVMRGGLPVTSPLRTCLDCARDLPFEEAVVILDALLNRQRVTAADLHAAARRQTGPNSFALRRAVRMADGRAGSGLETAARLLFLGAGLAVVPQYRLEREGHAYDFALVGCRLLIEVEGFAFHADRAQLDRDARHASEAAVAGWRLLRFTWEDITQRPEATLVLIRRAMSGAA